MANDLYILYRYFQGPVMWLAVFFVFFGLMARLTPCNPNQPVWRKDAKADLAYYLFMPLFNNLVHFIFLGLGALIIFYGQSPAERTEYLRNGFGPLATLPIWAQAAMVFILSDIILYWTHRWFHEKTMWRFHAIHHSSTHVDWLSTYRFHPINIWLSFTLVDVLMLLVGFSPASIACMGVVNLLYSAMVHANLNWTFGPFKYAFASPVFHRWHHTAQAEGQNKNFAPTFPILDIIFGTFYMPEGKLPEHYGVPGSDIPDTFLKQLEWPFNKR